MNEFYRPKDLAKMFKVNASTIWRWLAAGYLPEPIKLAENSTAWYAEEINEWIASRPRLTTKKAADNLMSAA
jgi:prophage regulatory protein